ncbi:MAG: restriction endonuclease [Nitrosotalea sp.]
MELKFQRDLDFQLDAINAVVDLFQSQKFTRDEFIVIPENGIIPNKLDLSENEIFSNLQEIQKRNGIPGLKKLQGMDFSIEMETGTGKTYVYLRTIFELYQNYGFKKFIIVVPSVAIREGVIKTLKITEKHFKEIYENTPYSYYEYDSSKINMVRQFARSNKIEIMIMTIDSFNKDTNIMNQTRDFLQGQKPIDFLNKARPILILDEPQKVEEGFVAKQAIMKLDSIFTLRYSATHKEYYNLIYRLTPVDAYKKNLVKKIEVMSVVKEGDFNNAFVRCIKIIAVKKGIKARLEVNKKQKNGFKVSEIVVEEGDDLFTKTQNREYIGFVVSFIDAKYNFVKFANGAKIRLGEESGGDRTELMRIQIEQTVQEHFEKYEILKKMGIKILSLFFIDKVDNYLLNDGILRKFFEDAFEKYKKEYDNFKNLDVKTVHFGYFSKMNTENAIKEKIRLIMSDKERLLSFEEPIQFIFSHSALREGWDNPNVFNICTLNQSVSTMRKRQEIGRGMRLPVNQKGERVHGDQNILTVIANESYLNYASTLQTEYEEEYGEGGSPAIEDRSKKTTLKLKSGFQLNSEFKELWKRIAKKTKYAVHFESDKLIEDCVSEIEKNISIDSMNAHITTASLSLTETNSAYQIGTEIRGTGKISIEKTYPIPDILKQLSDETKLTRATLVKILSRIKNLNLIFNNPQSFISSISSIIRDRLEAFLIDGVEYLEVDDWYKMELFKDIDTYQNKIILSERSIYDGIVWQSDIEKNFAKDLNGMNGIKLFIKLPSWFTVHTPIGEYNPDWAIVRDEIDQFGKIVERLYFVTETKGTTNLEELRPSEKRKIECAKRHFKTIHVDYRVVNEAKQLLS